MSLWGNIDYATGNNKPKFANTTLTTSESSIHGADANTDKYYGAVAGVSPTEKTVAATKAQNPAHAGWVSYKIGTGPLKTLAIANGGVGFNSAGFLIVSDGSTYGQGTGANVSFSIANAQNTLQTFSTNPLWNVISGYTIVNAGSGYSNAAAVTVTATGDNISAPEITVTLGGHAGRVKTEVLVAMGSITADNPADNAHFTGI